MAILHGSPLCLFNLPFLHFLKNSVCPSHAKLPSVPIEVMSCLCLCLFCSLCLVCPPSFLPFSSWWTFTHPSGPNLRVFSVKSFLLHTSQDFHLVCDISLNFISFHSPDKHEKMSRMTVELLRIIIWQSIICYIMYDCSLVCHYSAPCIDLCFNE